MTQSTEAPDLDLALVKEFELRKKKIELLDKGRQSIEEIKIVLNQEDDIAKVRAVALSFAEDVVRLAVENVDNCITALNSLRKYQSAINAMKFLILLIIISNFVTGFVAWLILR